MSHEFHTEEYKGCTIRIVHDDSPSDPRREYDNCGTMVPWDNDRRGLVVHGDRLTDDDRERFFLDLCALQLQVREKLAGKRYTFYEVEENDPECMSYPAFDELIEMALVENVILPYDYYVGSQAQVVEGDTWSKADGYIYIPMDKVRANWTGTEEEKRAKAEECLRCELKTLDNWIQGNVAGWIAEDPDGEEIESVWGYYPDEYPNEWDYPIGEARAAIDRWAEDQHELALQECMNI